MTNRSKGVNRMISANRTGAYISSLRKAKDWTQQELAESLHVTHQAVSQWEKGASFPDVALLPELARLLGVSVDDLLSGETQPRTHRATAGALVEELARGQPREAARLVRDDPAGVDAMIDAAPLARPSQIEGIVANLNGFQFTLEQAVSLAPFVSQAVLGSILDGAALEQVDGEILTELAPFIATETLDRLAQQMAAGAISRDQLADLAPFLSKGTLRTLVRGILDGDQGLPRKYLSQLAPFLDRETLEAFILNLPDGPLPIEQVVELAPFAGQSTLERLIDRLETPDQIDEYLEELAPFLSRATLQQVIVRFKGTMTTEKLIALAPFLGQEGLDAVLRRGARA